VTGYYPDAACAAFADALRAGDGLGEQAGARAVLERLHADVTVWWGVLKPELGPREVHWLRADGVNRTPLTEVEARTEAARRDSWQVVSRVVTRLDFTTGWCPESAT